MKKPGKKPASQLPDREEDDILKLLGEDFPKMHSSRRNFLKVFGYSFASAAVLAACRRPVRMAVPYPVQPPELVPRKPLYYASTFFDGHDYCAILVKNLDGRPIKIEGNPLSLFNGEGTTARVQASVLSLYDDARLRYPMINGKQAEWQEIDQQIINDLTAVDNDGGEIVLLTPTIISPSSKKLISSFGSRFRKFRWVKYDPVSYSAITEANEECFGKAVIPDYRFDKADVVLSVNCDFLGTWIAPVHFIPSYVSRRRVEAGKPDMLLHIQAESSLTLTGSNADKRIKIKPSEEKAFLTSLYNIISGKGNSNTSGTFRIDLAPIASKLVASGGRSIVVSGTNRKDIQVIVNGINSLLGNYSSCIDLDNPVSLAAGRDGDMEKLIGDMTQGSIKALLMYDVNPVYDYAESLLFSEGLSRVRVTVNMSVRQNETVSKARYECPVNHYLESWNDAEIIPGQLSLAQPCISPIFNTRSFQDSLLRWSGNNMNWLQYMSSEWQKSYFPLSGIDTFQTFWNKAVGDGVFSYTPVQDKSSSVALAPQLIAKYTGQPDEVGKIEVILAESVSMGNGMNANNPWLMELPDPVSRVTWENVAYVSATDAKEIGIVTGNVIRVGDEITIPAIIQPGQAEGTITIHLGYGHENIGPVASGKGVNVFQFAKMKNGNRSYTYKTTGITPTGETRELGLVQMHETMEGRPLVRETTLSEWKEKPSSGNEMHFEFEEKHKSLYPDTPFDGFHWAIAIDLNACIGCNTCVIACQAENNSPTVGKDQVMRNRVMHWIKVHRYYSEDQDEPKVYFQPVFCQQCDDAPCENVCPVSATNHSNEGLNQMAYNRCVGTKYCMNNCPYRVRRFNWYRYTDNKAFDYNTASDLGKMVLNPDVTVRERGVVEKCTFCVQRIQAKKLEAKIEGRTLRDLDIKPACMQACPAGAIVFGNTNDPESTVNKIFKDPRRYHLLEELHTLPSIGFLTKVRNDEKLS